MSKTIEEQAKDFLKLRNHQRGSMLITINEALNGLVDFAKLTQRWIPVEEELPPKEKDSDESEIVLIKETQDFGNFFLGWYDYHQKAWFMVYRLHRVKPTHWRSVL